MNLFRFSRISKAVLLKVFNSKPLGYIKPIRTECTFYDPCKFCMGRGYYRCLKCKGRGVYFVYCQEFKCTVCKYGVCICPFCGGDGQ